MEIQTGIQPNCSEIVTQICGVTEENTQNLKDRFMDALSGIYKEKYLSDYSTGLFAIEGKYNLNLFSYDGGNHIKDFEVLCKAAREIGILVSTVSCCSEPIATDEDMDAYLMENDNGNN
jgi:hypothetical protein